MLVNEKFSSPCECDKCLNGNHCYACLNGNVGSHFAWNNEGELILMWFPTCFPERRNGHIIKLQ